MNYREEINRIHKKLDSFALQGDLSIYDYYLYIDDLINEGKYSVLLNVMATIYGMDIRKFKTIDDFKKNSYKQIKSKTISKYQRDLNAVFLEQSVYNVGTHFYSSINNKYLGDILETEPEYSSNLYLLQIKPWETQIVNLNVIRGLSSAIFSSIPPFGSIAGKEFFYMTQSQVVYENKVYECISSFTWSKSSFITPTFSEYFTQSVIPNYSSISISDKNMSLIDKYSLGIEILKL